MQKFLRLTSAAWKNLSSNGIQNKPTFKPQRNLTGNKGLQRFISKTDLNKFSRNTFRLNGQNTSYNSCEENLVKAVHKFACKNNNTLMNVNGGLIENCVVNRQIFHTTAKPYLKPEANSVLNSKDITRFFSQSTKGKPGGRDLSDCNPIKYRQKLIVDQDLSVNCGKDGKKKNPCQPKDKSKENFAADTAKCCKKIKLEECCIPNLTTDCPTPESAGSKNTNLVKCSIAGLRQSTSKSRRSGYNVNKNQLKVNALEDFGNINPNTGIHMLLSSLLASAVIIASYMVFITPPDTDLSCWRKSDMKRKDDKNDKNKKKK